MKNYLTLLLYVMIYNMSFCQNEFKIFIGGGFENDSVSLIGMYYSKGQLIQDTLIWKEQLTSNLVTGLGKSIKARYTKNSRYDLKIEINEKTFLYQTDKLCNKSELRIEMYHDIDFCFLYKGGFKFY